MPVDASANQPADDGMLGFRVDQRKRALGWRKKRFQHSASFKIDAGSQQGRTAEGRAI